MSVCGESVYLSVFYLSVSLCLATIGTILHVFSVAGTRIDHNRHICMYYYYYYISQIVMFDIPEHMYTHTYCLFVALLHTKSRAPSEDHAIISL